MAQQTNPEDLSTAGATTTVLDAGAGNYFQFAQLTTKRNSGVLPYSAALDVSNDGSNFARAEFDSSVAEDRGLQSRIYARYVRGRLVVPNGSSVKFQVACQE